MVTRLALVCVALAVAASTAFAVDLKPVKLAAEDVPLEALYHQDFEAGAEAASGECLLGQGRAGQALHLSMPDGRYDVNASALDLGATGTIEWWVRLRPAAQGWWDQAWRYFLHARPAEPGGFQLDLWRHHRTQLRLSATMGMEPFQPVTYPDEKIEIDTRQLDINEWHHLLVSWDLTGNPQRVWLLVNGEGHEMSVPAGTFTPGSFASLEFGNKPSGWDTPHIPMDGGIDEIRVTRVSVAERLAQ